MVAHPDAVAPDLEAIQAVVAVARRQGRTSLLEPEGLALLTAAGIVVPRWVLVGDAEAAAGALNSLPGRLVVVKVVAAGLSHKTEVGGVAIVPRAPAAVAGAIDAMAARLAEAGVMPDGFLVAEHVEHDQSVGGELLVSLRWTDDIGPIVSVGAGGIDTEALAQDLRPGREIAIVSPTLTPDRDLAVILQTATAVRLATTPQRGQAALMSIDRLVDTVERLFVLGAALAPQEIVEIEINPAAVTADGLIALDVLIRLGSDSRPIPPVRPLHRIARMLEPRSIAIVGVSRGANLGRVILANLLREGYPPAQIVIVKPGVGEIDGVRCVPDLASLPGRVDLLVVALSAAQAPDLVAEAVERDAADGLIVIPSGFEEMTSGGERAARMREAISRARTVGDGGPVINGGNCLGIRSRPGGYDTLFVPAWKLPRGDVPAPIALITGSGGFAVTRLSRLGRLDPRFVITIGNQMDLTAGDYLTYLADDSSVRVIGVYLEGFRPLDGARFLEAAARITAEGRAVVLYRAGRTSAGARASVSHTASIAGDATITRELARQAGVALADTPQAFDDLVRTFTLLDGRRPSGRRVGAVTNAGSECVTIADHVGSLVMTDFAPETQERLAAILVPSGITSVVDTHNPIDLTPIGDAEIYDAVARIVLAADEVDVGIVGIVPIADTIEALEADAGHPEDLTRPGAIADRLAILWRDTTRPWVVSVDAGPQYDAFVERLDAAGIPTFRTADAAMRTLGIVCDVTLGTARD